MSSGVLLPTRPAVRAVAASKTYGSGGSAVTALDRVSLEVPERALTVVMGPSGAGKSTLLRCLAGLEDVTGGQVFLGELALHGASEGRLSEVRRDAVGFVFDGFNLLPGLTVGENLVQPARWAGVRPDPDWLEAVVRTAGLAGRLQQYPAELSAGAQQQVAIARTLVTRPQVMFADDPTEGLDYADGEQVLATLRSAVDDLGQTVVLATGDPRGFAAADQVLLLADGQVADRITPGASRPSG